MMSERSIMAIGKLFQRGKCVIPKEVREALGLNDGDRIYFIQDELGGVFLEKAPTLKKERLGKYR